ncbi:MAG: DinB family protein [Chloroflexota bacterium]
MAENVLTWSKSILVSTPIRWQYLVDNYPPELLSLAPAAGEWSALACLQHMVNVERDSTPVRLRAFLAGTSFPGFTPQDDESKETPHLGLGAEFAALRQQNLSLLNQVSTSDLDKEALHGEYGVVSLSHFLHHLAAHDLMHTVQAEQALMQPFIKGSGAWEVNYTAHIAKHD